jgi:phenylacetate-CoA ligase
MSKVANNPSTSIWNSKIEHLPEVELKDLQLSRLKLLLENLEKNNAFYKAKLKECGITGSTIKSLADIKHLPFTTKTDLQNNYPFGLFTKPVSEIARFHSSSGSKGKPTIVGYTANDLAVWSEVCARSLACAGVHPGDIIQNSYGYGLFTGGLGIHYGAELLGATVIPASGGMTRRQLTLLQDLKARVLCCTPTYAMNISHLMEELEIPLSTLNLQIGIFGAEPWTEEMRLQLAKKLSIQPLDIYGLSEIIGPGVSMECPHSAANQGGMHVWEDHFYAEIIDPKTGNPLPEGEEGELVFTTITKEAMPFLRYRTGDISSLSRQPCACGRFMVKMARVKARLDEMLIIRGVNFYPGALEKILVAHPHLSAKFLLIIDRQKAMDTINLQVELNRQTVQKWDSLPDTTQATANHQRLQKEIKSLLKDLLAISAEVELMMPGTLPHSEAKAVRVVDKRPKST